MNAVQDQILNTTKDYEMKYSETSEPCSTHGRYEKYKFQYQTLRERHPFQRPRTCEEIILKLVLKTGYGG